MYYDSVRIESDGIVHLIAGVMSLGVMPVRVTRCNSAAGTLPIK